MLGPGVHIVVFGLLVGRAGDQRVPGKVHACWYWAGYRAAMVLGLMLAHWWVRSDPDVSASSLVDTARSQGL